MTGCMLIFEKLSIFLPKNLFYFIFPLATYENPSYYPCQHLVCSLFFILVILIGNVLAYHFCLSLRFPTWVAQMVKSACSTGDPGSIPGSGRSPGEGNGNLLQYSCLESPIDRGAWQAAVHGVAKSWT